MAVAEFVYEISAGIAIPCIIFGAIASLLFLVQILEGTSILFISEFFNSDKAPIKKFLGSVAVLLFGIAIAVVHCKYMSRTIYTDDGYYLDQMVEEYDIRPLWISYDRALAGYWVPEMESYGFEMEKCAQGPFTWSQPMKEMGAAFSEHRVNYNNNPLLRWCLSNTGVKSLNKDGIETIQPVKLQQNRRIDGMVSLLNAWVAYVKHYDEYMPYVR